MKKVYQLNYSSEDYSQDFGIFSTKEKAEEAKKFIINTPRYCDIKDFWEREIIIYEIELNKINI